MYVETGISLRVPYRTPLTIEAAAVDMKYWNQFCDVNWSAYKFTRLNCSGVNPTSIFIDKFYIDIDVWQMGEKVNNESHLKLEDYLENEDIARVWFSTHHGYNCYIKAPVGCDIGSVEGLFQTLTHMNIDVDITMLDPLAQRKGINSYMHEAKRFVIPLTRNELLEIDIDDVVKEVATKPRTNVSDYWRGTQPFEMTKLIPRRRKEINGAPISFTDAPWYVNESKMCPVIAFLASAGKTSFFERLDMLKYFRGVLGVPSFKLKEFVLWLVGENTWKSASGWRHITWTASKGKSRFEPKRFKAGGYCHPACFQCLKWQDDTERLQSLQTGEMTWKKC